MGPGPKVLGGWIFKFCLNGVGWLTGKLYLGP
jgi:hypothetical protein